MERRAVDRLATAADFAAGSGSVIELNATGEEAVVGKTSRVVEEVLVGRHSSERTEAIRDSVGKTEVDIEDVPAVSITGTGIEEDRYQALARLALTSRPDNNVRPVLLF